MHKTCAHASSSRQYWNAGVQQAPCENACFAWIEQASWKLHEQKSLWLILLDIVGHFLLFCRVKMLQLRTSTLLIRGKVVSAHWFGHWVREYRLVPFRDFTQFLVLPIWCEIKLRWDYGHVGNKESFRIHFKGHFKWTWQSTARWTWMLQHFLFSILHIPDFWKICWEKSLSLLLMQIVLH